jgi:hypothetical protein
MGERMAKLENEVINLKDSNGEDHHRIESKIDKLGDNIDDFVKNSPSLFASKITERIVYGLVALIMIAFVTKLTNLW